MRGEKVLVVGCTGQVAQPIAMALALENDVWGVARFTSGAARSALERSSVVCHPVDLVQPDFTGLPPDFSYILNFSVARTGDWDTDLDVNGSAIAWLMEHASNAKALLHCSTIGVYEPTANHLFCEEDQLDDNHRVWATTMPFLSTYSISKIAAETVVRYASRRYGIPTTIGRLSVPYGNNGGWPSLHLDMMLSGTAIEVHPRRPNRFNPIHEDDILASIPPLLAAAAIPPTVVNCVGCSLTRRHGRPVSVTSQWAAERSAWCVGRSTRWRDQRRSCSQGRPYSRSAHPEKKDSRSSGLRSSRIVISVPTSSSKDHRSRSTGK